MANRTLVSGGYVITMDPTLGEITDGWVLVEDGKIAEVFATEPAVDAEVLDARGKVVMPGFVDTHRHTWQTQLRGIVAEMSLMQYMRSVRGAISPGYRPEDIYCGNLLGALEALDAGVTTILDYSHCIHSPEHADAGIKGLQEAGIRAVYAYGYAAAPLERPHFEDHAGRLEDAKRIKGEYFSSDDGLLTMGLSITEAGMIPFAETLAEVQSAKDFGAVLAAHTGCFWGSEATLGIRELHLHGMLDENQVHVHCNTLDPVEFRLLADAGAKVSSSPESEMSMGLGFPVFAQCIEHGIEPTLSCDLVSLNSGDMFTQMRLALSVQRAIDNHPLHERGEMPEDVGLGVREVLKWGTQNGANACGLGSRIGSLSPGKQADLIVVGSRADAVSLQPIWDPVGSMVTQAKASDVDAVMVAGEFVKRDGALLASDLGALVRLADDSRAQILASAESRGPLMPAAEEGWVAEVNVMAAGNLAQAYTAGNSPS